MSNEETKRVTNGSSTVEPPTSEPAVEPAPFEPAVMAALVAQRDAFVRFVRSRVESEAAAEEVVQSAFLRSIEQVTTLREDERATAWFYRILRNAIVDHWRRRDAKGRALERLTEELPEELAEASPDERNRVCACVRTLASTLKPEYAEVLEKVDVDGASIAEVAAASGITTNNATVRLHRARQALKKRVEETCRTCATHGCIDCTCTH